MTKLLEAALEMARNLHTVGTMENKNLEEIRNSCNSEIRQIIIVRKDLNMSVGKIAAQVAHASLKVILDLMHSSKEDKIINYNLTIEEDSELELWLSGYFTKIVVGCKNENELLKIYEKAKENNLNCCLITDAGLTEFNNIPTNTCVCIGPHYKYKLDNITKRLRLLS